MCGASSCDGAVVWIEMQNVLGWGVCFLLDYLIVIVDDYFFQMFTNVGNMGIFGNCFILYQNVSKTSYIMIMFCL